MCKVELHILKKIWDLDFHFSQSFCASLLTSCGVLRCCKDMVEIELSRKCVIFLKAVKCPLITP